MGHNIGTADRIGRLAIGGLLLVFGVITLAGVVDSNVVLAGLAILAGAILSVTGLTRTCLAYRFLGVDTSER